MDKSKLYIVGILIAIVVGYLICLFTQKEQKTVGTSKTDTISISKIDTSLASKPPKTNERTIDTLWLSKRNNGNTYSSNGEIKANDTTKYLPITQKKYEDSTYTAYVSGVNPNLDSIRTYSRNTTKIITNTIEKTTYKNSSARLYLIGGADRLNNKYSPNVGLGISFPKRLFISGKIGLYDNKPYYGFNIGYQIK